MKKGLLMVLSICFISNSFAQRATLLPSSYVAGNASVAYQESWLPFHNPASLGHIEHIGIGLIYENRYITKELADKSIHIWLPTKYINSGFGFSHFGYAKYHELRTSLSFGRKFGDRISIGVDAIYYNVYLSSSDYYRGSFTAQAGFQVDITENFSLAFSIFNPIFSKIKGEYTQKPLPSILSIGYRYNIRDVIIWLIQFDKEVSSPVRWATGFHYTPVKELVVRIGAYGYNDFRATIGVGIRFDNFKFDMSADYNSVLGFSILSALGYEF